mmetsp:Transcript_12062/g.31558  ORF Transcript_12062/g.31558 Transcript_12062/m.31558 type:complete len:268 (-) Transcript_12062:620-1423(-)
MGTARDRVGASADGAAVLDACVRLRELVPLDGRGERTVAREEVVESVKAVSLRAARLRDVTASQLAVDEVLLAHHSLTPRDQPIDRWRRDARAQRNAFDRHQAEWHVLGEVARVHVRQVAILVPGRRHHVVPEALERLVGLEGARERAPVADLISVQRVEEGGQRDHAAQLERGEGAYERLLDGEVLRAELLDGGAGQLLRHPVVEGGRRGVWRAVPFGELAVHDRRVVVRVCVHQRRRHVPAGRQLEPRQRADREGGVQEAQHCIV